MSAPVDEDLESAEDDLESSLGDIKDIAAILLRIGQLPAHEAESYLGGQLQDLANTALNAYRRIFKRDQHQTS